MQEEEEEEEKCLCCGFFQLNTEDFFLSVDCITHTVMICQDLARIHRHMECIRVRRAVFSSSSSLLGPK